MIKNCTCSNEFQDKLYGKGKRVMNECAKGTACRCTVCSKVYPLSGSEIKNKKTDEKKGDK